MHGEFWCFSEFGLKRGDLEPALLSPFSLCPGFHLVFVSVACSQRLESCSHFFPSTQTATPWPSLDSKIPLWWCSSRSGGAARGKGHTGPRSRRRLDLGPKHSVASGREGVSSGTCGTLPLGLGRPGQVPQSEVGPLLSTPKQFYNSALRAWGFLFLPHSYIKTQTPNMKIFGDGATGQDLGLHAVMRAGPPIP